MHMKILPPAPPPPPTRHGTKKKIFRHSALSIGQRKIKPQRNQPSMHMKIPLPLPPPPPQSTHTHTWKYTPKAHTWKHQSTHTKKHTTTTTPKQKQKQDSTILVLPLLSLHYSTWSLCFVCAVSVWLTPTSTGVNQRSKDVKQQNKQKHKDLSRLRKLSPGMQVNTRYINSTRGIWGLCCCDCLLSFEH